MRVQECQSIWGGGKNGCKIVKSRILWKWEANGAGSGAAMSAHTYCYIS